MASNGVVSVKWLLTEMTMLLSNGMINCFDLIIQILIGVYEAKGQFISKADWRAIDFLKK